MSEMQGKEDTFLYDTREIINSARQNAVCSVDFCRSRCISIRESAFLRRSSKGKTVLIMEHTL